MNHRTSHAAPVCLALLASLLFASACTGPQRKGPDYTFGGASQSAIDTWIAGDEDAAAAIAADLGDSPEELFSRAEIAYWDGDVERAFDRYLALVVSAPGDDLSRLAAARVYSMRGTILRWHERVLTAFEGITWEKTQPLTRIYLAMSGREAQQRVWSRSDTTEPWDSAAVGYPNAFTVTPQLSPWRLTSFDETYPGELEPFPPRYRTPLVAEENPLNEELTNVYVSQGTAAYPPLGSSGVYLVESYVTVEGDSPREYWAYAHLVGQTEIRIDDEVVFRRDEGDYSSPKFLRKVELSPGTHRIVTKMAFQRGYRDWFELAFVPTGAAAYDETGMTARLACHPERTIPDCITPPHDGTVELESDLFRMAELETIWVEPEQMEEASDLTLYLTMAHAYYAADDVVFEEAWNTLSERRPNFAAGHGLNADWLQTLWQVPSDLRDSRTQKALRKALELHPGSLRYLEALGGWLRQKDGEREAEELLVKARDLAVVDGRVRDVAPLNAWASYLSSKGWQEESEKAWRAALDIAPSNCSAAAQLMRDLHSRSVYPDPSELTPEHERCPVLERLWLSVRDDLDDERLELERRDALRAPWDVSDQRSLASGLERQGKVEEARQVLEEAIAMRPDNLTLWNALADLELMHSGEEAGRKVLERALEKNQRPSWLIWKLARIGEEIPLEEAMPDGLRAAREEVERTSAEGASVAAGANDEAYFVVDFAARHYYPDNTSITLTHTVVRVMTKGAIDQYGEQNLPGGAVPIIVRTIKQDGTYREPEQTSGKSVLSMPGLAEGDFVEVAYLTYESANTPKTSVDGVRFYFRMEDISTRHSEYVILGEEAELMRWNDAPEAEPIEIDGVKGMRFVARDNPRPRDEPHSVPASEYLPWIQLYRVGAQIDELEWGRRNYRETLRDSLKMSKSLEEEIAAWDEAAQKAGPKGSRAWVEELFYLVTAHVNEPSGGFSTDVSHIALTREGNPLVLLKAVYDALDVPSEVQVVKTAFVPDEVMPYGEMSRYSEVLLEVTIPQSGEVVWTEARSPDAMFGIIPVPSTGRPAICITCDEAEKGESPPLEAFPETAQSVAIDAQLGANGLLAGTATVEFKGGLAAAIRGILRRTTDDTNRDKFADRIMAGLLSATTVNDWSLTNEEDRGEPLIFTIQFTRAGFARQTSPGVLAVEERFFREPIASAYATLSERTTPLFIRNGRRNDFRLTVALPPGKKVDVLSQTGTRQLDTEFGDYRRTLEVGEGQMTLSSAIRMRVQRVPVAKYAAFQKWAVAVEQSSAFLMTLR